MASNKIVEHHFCANIYPEFQLKPKIYNNTADYNIKFKTLVGDNFGFNYSLLFKRNVFLNFGINMLGMSMKNYKYKFFISKEIMSNYILNNAAYKVDLFDFSKLGLNDRLTIPITLGYRFKINEKFEILPSAGIILALHINNALYDGDGQILDDGDSVRTYLSQHIEGKNQKTLAFGYYPGIAFNTSVIHHLKRRNALKYLYSTCKYYETGENNYTFIKDLRNEF
jgi:hypothetical protein